MLGINLDTADLQYLENEVDRLNRFGIPNAARDTLTSAAFETRDDSRVSLDKSNGPNFTLRNTFTQRSIMADRATGSRISQMKSVVGSIQPYMEQQETGFTKRSKGQFGIAMPTRAAAGQSGGGIRTRPISRRNWLQNLHPIKAYGWNIMGPSNKGRHGVLAAIYFSIEDASRVIFIDRRRDHFHRKTGFYRVIGGTKRNPEGARLKLIYSANRRSAVVRPHEWLEPKAMAVRSRMDDIYRKKLIKWIEKGRRK